MAFKISLWTPKLSPFQRLLNTRKEAFTQLMTYYMNKAVAQARINVTGGGSSRTQLNVRSGRLRSSITKQVNVTGNAFEGIIGSNVVYARIHEYGGEIRPRNARMLAIPMRNRLYGSSTKFSAVTAAGVARFKPSDVMFNTFIKKSAVTGKVFIFAKTGKGIGSVVPLFQLVPKVNIPKRAYLHPALESVIPELAQDIQNVMESRVQSVRHSK